MKAYGDWTVSCGTDIGIQALLQNTSPNAGPIYRYLFDSTPSQWAFASMNATHTAESKYQSIYISPSRCRKGVLLFCSSLLFASLTDRLISLSPSLVPFVFYDPLSLPMLPSFTPDEWTLAEGMSTLWGSFASSGNYLYLIVSVYIYIYMSIPLIS